MCGSEKASTSAAASVSHTPPIHPDPLLTVAERICYQAILEDRIKHPGWGVQRQLNRLATTPEFCAIYAREIAARRLTLSDVEHCRKDIYHTLAKHAYGNERTILIRTSDFTPSEVTAVVTYYKMQDAWGDDALVWMEVGAKE